MYRERLTITLDSELLSAVDATVDHSQLRNRSHAIEHALREGLALHELTTAVISISGNSTEKLPELTSLLEHLPILSYLVIATSNDLTAQDAVRSIISLTHKHAETIPGDFGTGAALLLNKARLTTPFLYIQLSPKLSLPTSLTAPYIAHRRGTSLVTHLIRPVSQDSFAQIGISLFNPEAIEYIPAGLASLEETTFPALLKAGKIGTYVTQ